MSSDEQDAAILRVVKSRAEAKKKKALLENELRAAGHALSGIGYGLESIGISSGGHHDPAAIMEKVAKAPDICDLSRVGVMLGELKEVNANLEQLNVTANDLGIG